MTNLYLYVQTTYSRESPFASGLRIISIWSQPIPRRLSATWFACRLLSWRSSSRQSNRTKSFPAPCILWKISLLIMVQSKDGFRSRPCPHPAGFHPRDHPLSQVLVLARFPQAPVVHLLFHHLLLRGRSAPERRVGGRRRAPLKNGTPLGDDGAPSRRHARRRR